MKPPNSQRPIPFGKYELIEHLASGGMADIFLARAATMQGAEKLLVIKRVHREKAADPELVRMFISEARMTALFDHPNLVQTYDVGRVGGEYFLAMEYIRGLDLQQMVKACQERGMGKPPMPIVVYVLAKVLSGLHHAHEKRDFDGSPLNITHRDISPQNVLVTYDGNVKVVDFGIAFSSEQADSTVLRGRAPYMSPEQATGSPIDRRSDIYSIGILLFELTLGRRLYKAGSEGDSRRMVIERPTPDPHDYEPFYPEKLRRIVVKALAKKADKRYATALAFQQDLESYLRKSHEAVDAGAFMMELCS